LRNTEKIDVQTATPDAQAPEQLVKRRFCDYLQARVFLFSFISE
jgi:hypothetical protein